MTSQVPMSSISWPTTSCCPTIGPWRYMAGSALSRAAHLIIRLERDALMYPADQIEALRALYGTGVTEYRDGPDHYVFIPRLRMPQGCTLRETDALFYLKRCAPSCVGYTSRLFLTERVHSPHTPSNYRPRLIAAETRNMYSHNRIKDGTIP
jgi:hypothetical protein